MLRFAAGIAMTDHEARAADIYRQAMELYRHGQLERAADLCAQSLELHPTAFDALHLSGVIAFQSARPQQAVDFIGRAISVNPLSACAHSNLGNALVELGRCEAAIACYDQAISIEREYADAYYNRANALFDLHRYEPAIDSYAKAIELRPGHWQAHNNCGLAWRCLKQYRAALARFDQAIEIEPSNPEAYAYRGDVLSDLRQFSAAIRSYDAAIAISPDYAEALNGRGSALAALNHYEAALDSYDRAIAARGEFAAAYFNRANVQSALGRPAEALAGYEAAIALQPDFAEAYYKRGDAQRASGQIEAAVASYDRALALGPGLKFLQGTRLHAKMQLCDWRDFESDLESLTAGIERGAPVCPPFALLALSGSAPLQRRTSEIYVREECPPDGALPELKTFVRRERIRIGYFSADFRNHPVSWLTAALFETHDRSAFEVIGFSTGPDTGDDMRKRLEAGFDRLIDLHRHSDRDIAALARSMEVDIAVDLGGFTNHARPAIFALRAAPLQIGYIGYLGTSGAPYMDYLIADRVLVPAEHRRHYSERIIFLPSYQANDPKRRASDRQFTRAELGLPASGFVFCCCNSPYKITPGTFAGWMRILKCVPQSVLMLYAPGAAVENNLKAEACCAGIDPGRLVFQKSVPMPEYLARYRAADLFLDTLPYNAGATASDALWAGLPVVTCAGEAFASRMAASLLTALGLPELIAPSQERYEALAIELASERSRLAEVKDRLDRGRQSGRLFDIREFVAHLEAAYRRVYDRHHAGLSPADIDGDA